MSEAYINPEALERGETEVPREADFLSLSSLQLRSS